MALAASTRLPDLTKFNSRALMPLSKSGTYRKQKLNQKLNCLSGQPCIIRSSQTECLAARGIQHDQFCPLCTKHVEDAQHLLTSYPFSKEVIHLICVDDQIWQG
jgi:hypothetical protein